jgi:hypothetical protein
VAEVAFRFDPNKVLAIESEVSPNVLVHIWLLETDIGSLESAASSHHHILEPPLPSWLEIVYTITGAPNTQFQLVTRFVQDNQSNVRLTLGII